MAWVRSGVGGRWWLVLFSVGLWATVGLACLDFGAWVFVGVFLGGAAVSGCFGGAVVGCRCCWWLQVMHCQWWVAVAVGDCRCCGFGVTMLGLVEYPDLGRQN